jgi:hypothetical protein
MRLGCESRNGGSMSVQKEMIDAALTALKTGEFWAAIVGAALGTLGSGVVSWALQREMFREERKKKKADILENNRNEATSIIIKLINIQTDIYSTNKYFSEFVNMYDSEKASSKGQGYVKFYSQSIKPVANLFQPISFTIENLTMINRFEMESLYNSIFNIEKAHHTLREFLVQYSITRNGIDSLLFEVSKYAEPESQEKRILAIPKASGRSDELEMRYRSADAIFNDIRRMLMEIEPESRSTPKRALEEFKAANLIKANKTIEFRE